MPTNRPTHPNPGCSYVSSHRQLIKPQRARDRYFESQRSGFFRMAPQEVLRKMIHQGAAILDRGIDQDVTHSGVASSLQDRLPGGGGACWVVGVMDEDRLVGTGQGEEACR